MEFGRYWAIFRAIPPAFYYSSTTAVASISTSRPSSASLGTGTNVLAG
jgi:hypothetical protein